MQTEEQRRSWERGWLKQKQNKKQKQTRFIFCKREAWFIPISKLGAEFSTFQTNFDKFDNNFISFRP